MNNKLHIIIDLSNILYRSVYACSYGRDARISDFGTQYERNVLIRYITASITRIANAFMADRVIIVCDTNTRWRNSLYNTATGDRYKGTRKHDETKNWDSIYKDIEKLKKIYKANGFVITSIEGAEADDDAAMWTEKLLADGDDVVLVSSDGDWRQLCSYDKDKKNFCICYNPMKNSSSLFGTEEFMNAMNDNSGEGLDIFFTSTRNHHLDNIKNAKTDEKLNYKVIDPNDVVLEKIMCGDTSDNVHSIFEYYKNGKKVRITPLKAGKIFESLNVKNVQDLVQSCNEGKLQPAIEGVMKNTIDDGDINEMLMRQRRLVELRSILFPYEITEAFNKHYYKNTGAGYVSQENLKMSVILNGSVFLEDDYNKPRENSIFDNQNLGKYFTEDGHLKSHN